MTDTRARRLEPLFLLFASGGLIGLIFPLAQLAGDYGLSPLVYAGLSAGGASAVLFAGTVLGAGRMTLRGPELRYALIAGLLTFAIPFGVLVAVIPRIGSGVPAILQSAAPLLTLGIALGVGLERFAVLRGLSLVLGLVGVLLILLPRFQGAVDLSGDWIWFVVALITPTALAFGNVYRTTAWPRGSDTVPLAVLTLAAAALCLLGLAAVPGVAPNPWAGLSEGWFIIVLQSLFTGIGYGFFFRLQRVGGPVYLSQISYVNTAVGVGFAVLAFSERLPPSAWLSMGLIFGGIALMTVAKQKQG